MKRSMSAKDFLTLCKFAIERGNLNPKETYCEITWWDDVFKPIIGSDGDYRKQETFFIVGEDKCNFWTPEDGGIPVPCGFYIIPEAHNVNCVVHRPMTLHKMMVFASTYNGDEAIGFLFSNSPVNYWVGIDPFKTRIYNNMNNEVILCFYVDDRDSGEWQPFDRMKPEHIKIFDDRPIGRKEVCCDEP